MSCVALLLALAADAATFHVATDGIDAAERSGESPQSAFKSLAYACERAGEGDTIRLGRGVHLCTRPAVLKSGQRIVGHGFHGPAANWAILQADPANWERPLADANGAFCGKGLEERALIGGRWIENISMWGVKLQSDPADPETLGTDDRLPVGIHLQDVDGAEFTTCRFEDFRWAGVYAFVCRNLTFDGCGLVRCSTDRCRHRGGQLYLNFVRNLEVAHTRFMPARGDGGYGLKGGGLRGARIHDNTFEPCYFAIELPHENEHGVEIDHNEIHGAISIPKGGDASPPQRSGFDLAFDIHHNLMTDSYGIEGPRNYLHVHHNHVRISKPGGRFYTQFGGHTDGPIWIERNIIENVDRALVWQREGTTNHLTFRRNTVICADAAGRNERLFGVWAGDRIADWTVSDNVIVSPLSYPRTLIRQERGVPEQIAIRGNVLIDLADPPPGNLVVDRFGGSGRLFERGDRGDIAAFYTPVADGPLIDAAGDDIRRVREDRPDLGAVERGEDFGTIGPRPR